MRERLLVLAERRARLSARAQAERETIAALMKPADGATLVAISAFRAAQRALAEARRHPLIMVAGVALMAALRPARAINWLAKGWSLWRLYRGASGWWRRFETFAGTPAREPK